MRYKSLALWNCEKGKKPSRTSGSITAFHGDGKLNVLSGLVSQMFQGLNLGNKNSPHLLVLVLLNVCEYKHIYYLSKKAIPVLSLVSISLLI